jgi:putative transposase
VAALEEALTHYDKPEIFNTDQGSQFTSDDFIGVNKNAGIRISMDGKGRWVDIVMIERLWRSLKYECIYLHAFEVGSEVRQGLKHWIDPIMRVGLILVWTIEPLMRPIGNNPVPAMPDRS